MKFSKKIKGLAIVCASLLVVSGCSNEKKDSKKADNKENEIVFWNPFTGADNSNIKAMIDAYNKTNPDFKVKNVSLKETDMYTKIPTVVNSGKNIPDINIVHAERIKQYKDNDMLVSFDDYLADFPEIKPENYVAEAWNLGDIDGTRYSLPLDIHSWGTYYNKELVEKYAPSVLDDEILTFDEALEVSKKANKDDIYTLGASWVKPNFLSLMKQYGGELTTDGTTPTLDTDASMKAFEKWNELYEAGVTTKDGEDPAQLFLSGKLIFLPEGIWAQNNIKEAKFEWGLTNSPQISDDPTKTVNWASSHQFVMFNNEQRSEEKTKGVLEFINWIRDNSKEWAIAGQNPAALSILDDADYQEMPQSIFIKTQEQQDTLTIFDYKYNGYVAEYLDSHGYDAVFGKITAKDMVEGMQKEVSDKVAKDKSN